MAGWLLERFWWGSLFLVNVPLIALAILLGLLVLPAGGHSEDRHVDVIGIVLSVVGFAGLTYGLIQAPVDGWSNPVVVAAGLGGLVVLAAFLAWEARQREPLLDTRLWRVPAFSWGAGAVAIATLVGMVALFSGPLYQQGVLGVDALGSGARLLPLLGGLVGGIAIGVRTAGAFGARAAFTTGLTLLGVGAVLAARTDAASPYSWAATLTSSHGQARSFRVHPGADGRSPCGPTTAHGTRA